MSNTNGEVVLRGMPLEMLPTEEEAGIQAMSNEQLREELSRAMENTARALLRLAVVVRVMEDRGQDVSEMRLPLLTYLRQIAEGRLLPSLVARFVECPAIIRLASRVSTREQQTLAEGKPVLLVVRDAENSSWTHRQADPTRLQPDQVRQVFAINHLRSESEQILWLEAKSKPKALPTPGRHGVVRADAQRNGLVIGRTFVSLENVLSALADLVGDEDTGDRTETIASKVTPEEHRKLKQASVDGQAIAQQIRRALRIAGLI